MKMQKIKEIAKKVGVDSAGKNKTDLVRAIQRAEGYCDCFASPQIYKCNQLQCLWRKDCGQAVHEEDLPECDAA